APQLEPTSASNSVLPNRPEQTQSPQTPPTPDWLRSGQSSAQLMQSAGQRSQTMRYQNRPSQILTANENEILFSLLGDRCTALATTVCRLFFSKHGRWKLKCTASSLLFATLIDAHFFYVSTYNERSLIFEQEIYQGMEYERVDPTLYQFEADDKVVAVNFMESEIGRAEAEEIANHLNHQVTRMGLREDIPEPLSSPSADSSEGKNGKKKKKGKESAEKPPKIKTGARLKAFFKRHKPGRSKDRDKTVEGAGKSKKIRPEDISGPTDSRHVLHVGYNDAQNKDAKYELDIAKDPALRFLLGKLGYDLDKTAQSSYGREQIAKVVNSIGGMEQVYAAAASQGFDSPMTPVSQMSARSPASESFYETTPPVLRVHTDRQESPIHSTPSRGNDTTASAPGSPESSEKLKMSARSPGSDSYCLNTPAVPSVHAQTPESPSKSFLSRVNDTKASPGSPDNSESSPFGQSNDPLNAALRAFKHHLAVLTTVKAVRLANPMIH
ncbi:hypothetical protein BOX15_Mlig005246g3, partial [Macrostomum lignano]